MGSYGGILVMGLLFISVIPMMISYVYILLNYQEMMHTLITQELNNEREKIRSSIEIINDNMTWINDTVLRIPVLNNGDNSIYSRDLKYVNVILEYYSNGNKVSIIANFNQVGSNNTDYWKIYRVYDESLGYEVLNPIRVNESNISGAWDSNEIMIIEVHLSPLQPRDNSTSYIVVVSSPDGTKTIATGD